MTQWRGCGCPWVLPGLLGLTRVRGGRCDKPFFKKPEACKEGTQPE